MFQKTTELGIQKFVPLLCQRSIVREINIERAEKLLTEASEQSNRISIPEISKIQKLKFYKVFQKMVILFFAILILNLIKIF